VTGLTESAAAAELRLRIDTLSKAGGTAQAAADDPAVRVTIEALMDALEAGTVRAAACADFPAWASPIQMPRICKRPLRATRRARKSNRRLPNCAKLAYLASSRLVTLANSSTVSLIL